MGHSLGTDVCSIVLNDPRGLDSPILPERLVLLDPICFAHEVPAAHRLPFWTWEEAQAKKPGVPALLVAIMLYGVIRDEYNQQACKRAMCPGTDTVFRASPELLQRCRTLLCFSGEDAALPAWEIHDYVRAQFPDVRVEIDPAFPHGGFLTAVLQGSWLGELHLRTVLHFLGKGSTTATVTGSHPDVGVLIESSGGLQRRNSQSAASFKW